MNKHFIYTLTNPINQEVFYVGCTTDIEKREKQHGYKTVTMTKRLKAYYKKHNVVPVFKVLAAVKCIKKASDLEQMYIKLYRDMGYELANSIHLRPYKKTIINRKAA
jgi:predicted GIY-YIG superfamily endonuclease